MKATTITVDKKALATVISYVYDDERKDWLSYQDKGKNSPKAHIFWAIYKLASELGWFES